MEIVLKQPCQKENSTSSLPKKGKPKLILFFISVYSSAMEGHIEHWRVDDLSTL